MQKKINNHQKNLKDFLSAKEINHLMNEVFSKMLKYSDKKSIIYKNKKIDFLLNRSKFDKEYNKIKKNKNWNKFYESLKNLKSYRKIIIPKSKKYFQEIFGKKCKIVNSQIRVIEKICIQYKLENLDYRPASQKTDMLLLYHYKMRRLQHSFLSLEIRMSIKHQWLSKKQKLLMFTILRL